jgi:hypothetical protein
MELRSDLIEAFAFYSALLLAKVLVMSFLTARQRFGKKVRRFFMYM